MKRKQKMTGRSKARLGALVTGLAMMATMVPMAQGVEAQSDALLAQQLQAWYSFDQGTLDISARTVDNLATDDGIYDAVLGSLASASSTGITEGTGISGSGLHFEGNQAENYMKISQILNSTQDYTISLWMKMAEGATTDKTSINVVQQTGSGRTVMMVKNKTVGSYVGGADIMAPDTVDYGVWNHVVITGDNTGDTENGFQIFLNGEKVVDQNVAVSSLVDALTDLQFGCHKNTKTGYSFTGDLDSIRIYNKTADESLVQALFAEHGATVVYGQLQSGITAAQTLLEEAALDAEGTLAQSLTAAVEKAQKLTQDSTLEELTAAYTALTAATQAYEDGVSALPVNLSIDPNKVVRQIPEYMFGVNHRYHMDGYGSWDTENDQLYEEFQALCDSASFGSIRYPGGIVSNLFDWKRSIGEERQTTIHGNWDEPAITPNFGVDEAAQYIIDEMGGEMIYVYNFGNGSAQDAADLVEYLNCEVGENPNGGIDWAKVRADNGHPQPYGVTQFEIGNEVDEGRGYWMQADPNTWSNSSDAVAKMYAEGAVRTFTKEKVAEFDNWNTTSDKTKASHYSDGTAGQVKYMRYANDVTEHEDKSKMVQKNSVHVYVDNVEWTIVEDIATAGAENVVQVNYENGEIRFGDGTHGNIPANGADIRVTYTVEKDGIADYYDAMKAVDPDIKIYSGFSSSNIAKVIYESQEAGADGGKFDGIAVHPYSRTNGQIQDSDPQFYEKILAAIDSSVITQINNRKAELDKYWPDGSKNVCISEYGIFNHSGDVVQSQTHAVYIAQNLMEFVDLGVAYTNKHCLIDFPAGDVLGPGKQALILASKNQDGTYSYYGTPSLEVLKLFNTMSATQVVDTQITRNTEFYQGVESVDAMVTKDDQGNLYVVAVNTERDKEKAISIQVDGVSLTGKTIQGMKLESEDVYAVNSLADPDNVKAQTFTLTCDSDTLEYTMQPHSVVGFQVNITPKANDFEVQSITADGKDVLDQADENHHITLTLEKGEDMPVLAATATNNATVVVTPAANVNGQATITITSEDGTKTVTYTVSFQGKTDPDPDPTTSVDPDPDPTTSVEPESGVTVDNNSGVTVTVGNGDKAFEAGAVITVESVTQGDVFDTVKEALKDVVADMGKTVILDINATLNGKDAQPDGKVQVTFAIPEHLSADNLKLFYVSDDGKTVEEIQITVDKDAKTVTANLEHFSTYVLANVAGEDSAVPPTADRAPLALSTGMLVGAGVCLVLTVAQKRRQRNG